MTQGNSCFFSDFCIYLIFRLARTSLRAQIEHFAKSIKYGAILGGSEEIMVDFGARQAVKAFPKSAKL